jgi:hypothetical protein
MRKRELKTLDACIEPRVVATGLVRIVDPAQEVELPALHRGRRSAGCGCFR